MRYEPEHKAQTRDRIVRNAARKLRAEGLGGPGVASVMKASGLTVGGFYKHFRSKDELLADAIAQAFAETNEKIHSALQSEARGTVQLRSANPAVHPAIRVNYLSGASDRERWVRGVAMARELLSQRAFAEFDGGEVLPGPDVVEPDR